MSESIAVLANHYVTSARSDEENITDVLALTRRLTSPAHWIGFYHLKWVYSPKRTIQVGVHTSFRRTCGRKQNELCNISSSTPCHYYIAKLTFLFIYFPHFP